jgi:dUTP pyrophosphatase
MLSGASIVSRAIVRNLRSAAEQQQPCGVDLTLRRVHVFTSQATIDFDNTRRRAANTTALPFEGDAIKLEQGVYRIDFNEAVEMPRDCAGRLEARSTLWRSGVSIKAGVIDAGYYGALGALLSVENPHGVELHQNAKLAQMVVSTLQEEVEGYRGIYQSSENSAGLNGREKADGKPE